MDLESTRLFLGIPKGQFPIFILSVWRLIVSVFMLWAMGAFGRLGFPGFVRVDDIQGVTASSVTNLESQEKLIVSRLARIEQRSLANSMQNAKALECNSADKQFARDQLIDLQFEYRNLMGYEFNIPRCDQLK